jgi:hypothetical protein
MVAVANSASVVIQSHAHPTAVAAYIIDPIRSDLAQFLIGKIVGLHCLWSSFRLPFPASVLELAYQLFLFRIHGNNRLSALLKRLRLRSDVLELGVTIRMRRSLFGLTVGLQAVLQVLFQ